MDGMQEKNALLHKLIGIQDVEAVKPVDTMDTDLIAECTGFILELTGETLPSGNVLRKAKRRLLLCLRGAAKRRRVLLRRLLIAAVVAMLIAALSVSLMPSGTTDESLVHRWFYGLWLRGPGTRKDFGEYLTIVAGEKPKEYRSIRQFVRKTGADLLVPTVLPEGYTVQQVNLSYQYDELCYYVRFITNDPEHVGVNIWIGQLVDPFDTWEKQEKIGGLNCGFALSPGWCQCSFMYEDNQYIITAESYEDLVLIVKNMKGSLDHEKNH